MSQVFSGYLSYRLQTFNVFQWRLATSYMEEVTETRNCRDLAVAGLQPGHIDRP
jgi:hypothetical protein